MAYTKIHAIKATVDKAIEYICNPDKTDEQIYVSSYACASETAAIDFKYTLDHCRENRTKIKSTKLIRDATITKNRTNNKAYVEGMVDIITSYDAAILP